MTLEDYKSLGGGGREEVGGGPAGWGKDNVPIGDTARDWGQRHSVHGGGGRALAGLAEERVLTSAGLIFRQDAENCRRGLIPRRFCFAQEAKTFRR
jgi:hypothetical protein